MKVGRAVDSYLEIAKFAICMEQPGAAVRASTSIARKETNWVVVGFAGKAAECLIESSDWI